jgi:hypothetical protein
VRAPHAEHARGVAAEHVHHVARVHERVEVFHVTVVEEREMRGHARQRLAHLVEAGDELVVVARRGRQAAHPRFGQSRGGEQVALECRRRAGRPGDLVAAHRDDVQRHRVSLSAGVPGRD